MKKNMSLFIIPLFVLLIGCPTLSHAAGSRAADYLVQLGELSYQRGDMESAVHEFNKALMVDPNNETAIRRLSSMGQMLPGEVPQAVTTAAKIDQLTKELEVYKKTLAYVDDQRYEINMKLKQLTMEHEGVLQDNHSQENELKRVQSQVESMGVHLDHLRQERRAAMLEHQSDFEQSVKKQAPQADFPDQALISERVKNALSNKQAADSLDVALERENALLVLNRENLVLDKALSQEKSSQQNALEVMEDYLYVEKARMNDLGTQTAINNLDHFVKHQQLLDKTAALNDSNNALIDVIRKAEEREAMIQQKNLQINDLQKRLEWYQKSFEEPANPQL